MDTSAGVDDWKAKCDAEGIFFKLRTADTLERAKQMYLDNMRKRGG
jgi:hypothetical protein